jgi:hypothetical protein
MPDGDVHQAVFISNHSRSASYIQDNKSSPVLDGFLYTYCRYILYTETPSINAAPARAQLMYLFTVRYILLPAEDL